MGGKLDVNGIPVKVLSRQRIDEVAAALCSLPNKANTTLAHALDVLRAVLESCPHVEQVQSFHVRDTNTCGLHTIVAVLQRKHTPPFGPRHVQREIAAWATEHYAPKLQETFEALRTLRKLGSE